MQLQRFGMPALHPPPVIIKSPTPTVSNSKYNAVMGSHAFYSFCHTIKQRLTAAVRRKPAQKAAGCEKCQMEHQLHIQRQNSAPITMSAARPRLLFSSRIPVRKTSAVSLRACPMTGTLPVNSSPSRSVERSNCTVIARCSPSKTAKRRPAQRSPFAAVHLWRGRCRKALSGYCGTTPC